eukprot:299861-Pelagomonas_calceolata.AAC.2
MNALHEGACSRRAAAVQSEHTAITKSQSEKRDASAPTAAAPGALGPADDGGEAGGGKGA